MPMELKLNSSSDFEQQMLSRLLESWKLFVNRLPVHFDAASSIPLLEDFGTSKFSDFKTYAEILLKSTEFRKSSGFEEGMNSPGILWDRLTILNCKLLFTAADSIHHKPDLHRNLGNVLLEIKSVSNALNKSLPAKHILLAKEATARQKTQTPLENSLWLLQQSNIAMWINQDLLYTVSADDVQPQRLRDYIRFFSVANRIRNTAIESIEHFYIKQFSRK
jgi:hypothetical protein